MKIKTSVVRILFFVFSLGLTACTSVSYQPVDSQLSSCLKTYQQLDRVIKKYHLQDAGVARVAEYPFLRTTRFLASFTQVLNDSAHYKAWLNMLNAQAVDTLQQEARRLPDTVSVPSERTLLTCGDQLVSDLAMKARLKSQLINEAAVPDSYRYWQRVVGLYPLTAVLFRFGILRDQKNLKQQGWPPLDAPPEGDYQFYSLNKSSGLDTPTFPLPVNSLGVPLLNSQLHSHLLSRYAPTVATLSGHDFDRLGTPLSNGFSSDNPDFYSWIDYGWFNGEVSLRLNYSIWFSGRPKDGAFDLFSGQLDGLTWRVHLTLSGKVLAWDSMHNCGCWYRLYPARGFSVKAEDALYREPVYVAEPLTDYQEKVLYLESGTHHILAVRDRTEEVAESEEVKGIQARLRPYAELKPYLFAPSGLVLSSVRAERWLFWPMGVPSPGAMRVAGTHAIAFLGTRHFDDPFLLEDIGLVELSPIIQ